MRRLYDAINCAVNFPTLTVAVRLHRTELFDACRRLGALLSRCSAKSADRLVQAGKQDTGQVSARNNEGDTHFSHDDIARVSQVVRLA